MADLELFKKLEKMREFIESVEESLSKAEQKTLELVDDKNNALLTNEVSFHLQRVAFRIAKMRLSIRSATWTIASQYLEQYKEEDDVRSSI